MDCRYGYVCICGFILPVVEMMIIDDAKISDVIKVLEKALKAHGDIPVMCIVPLEDWASDFIEIEIESTVTCDYRYLTITGLIHEDIE